MGVPSPYTYSGLEQGLDGGGIVVMGSQAAAQCSQFSQVETAPLPSLSVVLPSTKRGLQPPPSRCSGLRGPCRAAKGSHCVGLAQPTPA